MKKTNTGHAQEQPLNCCVMTMGIKHAEQLVLLFGKTRVIQLMNQLSEQAQHLLPKRAQIAQLSDYRLLFYYHPIHDWMRCVWYMTWMTAVMQSRSSCMRHGLLYRSASACRIPWILWRMPYSVRNTAAFMIGTASGFPHPMPFIPDRPRNSCITATSWNKKF